MNLHPFTPPALPDRDAQLDELAGIPSCKQPEPTNVASTSVGVMRWEPIVVKLVATGTGPEEAAGFVKVPVEQVVTFLAGRGKDMIKAYVGQRPARMSNMLEGMTIDVIMVLGRIMHTSKQDSARVAAAKQLLELAQDAKNKSPKTPEEIKREAEARIAARMDKAQKEQTQQLS